MRTPYEACITAVTEIAEGKLTADETKEIFDEIIDRKNAILRGDALKNAEQALEQAAKELTDEKRLAAIVERRARAFDVQAKMRLNARVDARPGKEAETLAAMSVGDERTFDMSGNSTDARRQSIGRLTIGAMMNEFRQGKLLVAIRSAGREMQLNIARAIFEASGGKGGQAAEGAMAKQIGAIIAKYQESLRVRTNDAGAWIRKMPGWIVRQSHDMVKINKAGFQAWREFVVDRLDARTFLSDGITDPEEWLKEVYNNLITGSHLKPTGAVDDWLGGFKGAGNRAKRVSQSRQLHFRDADAWFEYHEKFGQGTIMEAVLQGIESSARNIALMEDWGTNPQAMFDGVVRQLTMKAQKSGDRELVAKLNGRKLTAEFDEVTGANSGPSNYKAAIRARYAQTVRNTMAITKLPFILISSWGDIAVHAATLRHNGVGFLEAVGNSFHSIVRGRGNVFEREVADLVGAGFDGLIGNVYHRFSSLDGVPGAMAKFLDTMFTLNGQNYWTDAQMTGVGLMLSRNLARNAEKAFDDLDPLLRGNLTRYGFDADSWEKVRALDMHAADGKRYMTPDVVNQIEDKALAKKLERALSVYYTDQVAEAMGFAGGRQRAMMKGYYGPQPGTALGEAIRFVMQFKSYGITFGSRQIRREWLRTGRPWYAPDPAGLAKLMLATTAIGYASMNAKDLIKGRTPRDPTDLKTWIAALQQGGGFGIYGDFLFSEVNRNGNGLIGTAAGPAIGTLEEGWSAINDMLRGPSAQAAKTKPLARFSPIAKFLYQNAPMGVNNFIVTKTMTDYLVLYNLQEWLNPGYLKRMQSEIAKDNSQTFWLPPTKVVKPGGGIRLGG
jgi:hypothetical protein